MKLNKKGTSIIELLVSVIIISLVLTFMLQLYVRIRGAYMLNSVNLKYELSKNIIIDAVMKDFINYNVKLTLDDDIKNRPKSKQFHFYTDDPNNLTDKVLFWDDQHVSDGYYDLKYCEGDLTNYTNCIVRRYDSNDLVIPNEQEWITYSSTYNQESSPKKTILYKIKINIKTVEGDDYSIKLYLPLNLDEPVTLENQ